MWENCMNSLTQNDNKKKKQITIEKRGRNYQGVFT